MKEAQRKKMQAGRAKARKKAHRDDVLCGDCGGPTAQNGAERATGKFWCPSCQYYPRALKLVGTVRGGIGYQKVDSAK